MSETLTIPRRWENRTFNDEGMRWLEKWAPKKGLIQALNQAILYPQFTTFRLPHKRLIEKVPAKAVLFSVCRLLRDEGPMTRKDLADKLCCSEDSLYSAVRSGVEQNFIGPTAWGKEISLKDFSIRNVNAWIVYKNSGNRKLAQHLIDNGEATYLEMAKLVTMRKNSLYCNFYRWEKRGLVSITEYELKGRKKSRNTRLVKVNYDAQL